MPKSSIILVTDKELETLSDPDAKLNLALGHTPFVTSLRETCERARAQGQRTLILAFDHFFAQYRPGQEGPRRLTPDKDEFIQRIAGISKFLESYGLWMHYRKGVRDTTALMLYPLDDQSGSLGSEARTWFEILRAVGTYPASSRGTAAAGPARERS